METKYTTVSGHTIDLADVDAASMAFLERLRTMLEHATEAEVIALAYSRENPFLAEHPLFGDRGYVTREVLDSPAYQVLADLLARIRLVVDHVDIEKLAAEHTLSVTDVAERLGVHTTAVRKAIATHRLPAWVKDGQYWIRPAALASFELAPRGPKPEARVHRSVLSARIGSAPGSSFRVKHNGLLIDEVPSGEHAFSCRIRDWDGIVVMTGKGESQRAFVIKPSNDESEIVFEGFYVRGGFEIEKKVNNAAKARETWASIPGREVFDDNVRGLGNRLLTTIERNRRWRQPISIADLAERLHAPSDDLRRAIAYETFYGVEFEVRRADGSTIRTPNVRTGERPTLRDDDSIVGVAHVQFPIPEPK